MKRLLNFKFLLAGLIGAGAILAFAALRKDDDLDDEHLYGEPDGAVTEEDVASFVD